MVAQFPDAVGDQVGLDAVFEGLNLQLDAAVGVGELLADLAGGEVVVAAGGVVVVAQLITEPFQAHGAEDALGEEPFEEILERLADHMICSDVPGARGSALLRPRFGA